VLQGGPADKAGIKPGDVLLDVNGEEITDTTRLLNVIAQIKPGTDAKVLLMRKNKEMQLVVTIGKRPPPPKQPSSDDDNGDSDE
jgi:serine protease DegQ